MRLDDDHCPSPDAEPTRKRLSKTLQALVKATSSSSSSSDATYKGLYRVMLQGTLQQRPLSALLSELQDMYTEAKRAGRA